MTPTVPALLAVLGALSACEDEGRERAAAKRKSFVARTESGEPVVALDPEALRRAAIRTGELAEATFKPEVVAYGHFQEDPAGARTLRSPVAGVLRAGGHPWPSLGQAVADGTEVGLLEPRLAPAERADLATRLSTARAEAEGAAAAAAAARAALERARTLNAENKTVSDRALQEAEARLKGEEARLKASQGTALLLEAALSGGRGTAGAIPLLLERGGDVVEILAQPGEAVESGQSLLRTARYDRLLARIVLPPGEAMKSPPPEARIVPMGADQDPLTGERIALDGVVDPANPGRALLYRVTPAGRILRPGMAVTAYLPVPGEPLTGVMVPRPAIIRWEGKAWVYLRLPEDPKAAAKNVVRYARRPVELDHPSAEGWFVTSGVRAGDRIVLEGAQALHSEELKSLIQVEEEP